MVTLFVIRKELVRVKVVLPEKVINPPLSKAVWKSAWELLVITSALAINGAANRPRAASKIPPTRRGIRILKSSFKSFGS